MAADRTLPTTIGAMAAAAIGLAGFAWLYIGNNTGPGPSPALSQAESLAARPSAPMPLTTPASQSRNDAAPGEIAASRTAIDFGDIAPGATAEADLTVTARNAAMVIDRIDLSSPDPALRVGSTCRKPDGTPAGPIPAGGSCAVTLAWTPSAPVSLARDLTVQGTTSLADGTPKPVTLTIPLSGRAQAAPEPAAAPSGPAMPPRNPLRDAIALAIAQPLAPSAGPAAPAPPAGPADPDWTGLGWERNTASKPVDLTGVISVEQVIPAVLERPIDSRFPSRAIAMVERPIHAARGGAVILQRGDHLIGRTAGASGAGAEKVAILWDRVIRQDGTAWAIEGIAGDAMGRAGVIGRIDTRFFERFGSAMAASLISVAGTLAIGGDEKTTGGDRDGYGGGVARDARSRAGDQFVQDSRDLVRRMLEESIDIAPIVEIPAGTRLTVFPSTDLWLRPATGEDLPRVSTPPAPSIAPRGLYPGSTRPGQPPASPGGFTASEPAWPNPDPLPRTPPGPEAIRPPADAGRAPWSTP